MVNYPYLKLNNGNTLPAIGMGTGRLEDEGRMQERIDNAVNLGYRLFDTAAFYRNEKELGEALKNNGIPRSDIFISSKLKNGHHKYDDALSEFHKSIERLGVDYLDLYLIHYPCPEHGLYTEAWTALEYLYKQGYVKNIGVSNFHQSHLENILKMCEIKPVIDQLLCNPYMTIEPLRAYLKEQDIQAEAWSPLGGAPLPPEMMKTMPQEDRDKILDVDLRTDPVLSALAEKYGRTVTQIILRWDVQNGVIPIPKAGSYEHMKENISVFDFELTDEDVTRINALNINYHGAPDGDTCNEYWE